jgi:hypothetical protein
MPDREHEHLSGSWRPQAFDADNMRRLLAQFGRAIEPRLALAKGSPENNIRGPFENLVRDLARLMGVSAILFGEEHYVDLGVRPDYVLDVAGRQVGLIELKAPGKGADPGIWTPGSHDAKQWGKLRMIPNVLYTDELAWSVYRNGERSGPIVNLGSRVGDLQDVTDADGVAFLRLFTDFCLWRPERPRTLQQATTAAARLCGLLRDEVRELLAAEAAGNEKRVFMRLAKEWRQMLFNRLDDDEFADAYAQTVTFALLLARVESIDLENVDTALIARQLSKHHTLMGRAFGILTDRGINERSIVLNSLIRVIGTIDWEQLDAGESENAYAYLYERFLQVYDPKQRRETGSYYTPAELVGFMVRFVDQVLRSPEMKHPLGLASPDLTIIDPAMGTGSYIDEIIRTIARTIEEEYGPGQVAPTLREAIGRLIGFEKQAGPFSVAEMRLHRTLKRGFGVEPPARAPRFLTDTLDELQPELEFYTAYEEFEDNYAGARKYKTSARVQVAISNPPFGDKAGGRGGFIERRPEHKSRGSLLDDFRSASGGRHTYVLSSQVIYFWRWATWKVFDSAPRQGAIIAFVSPSAFLHSPGFSGMREYLRRQADAGWIVDLTPEGHQPAPKTRLFPRVAQPLCVALFVRYGAKQLERPAAVSFAAMGGSAADKLQQLKEPDPLRALAWRTCPGGWSESFRPEAGGVYGEYLELSDIFPWFSRGVTAGRTWVYAPDREVLYRRWRKLMAARDDGREQLFVKSRDRHLDSVVDPLPGQGSPTGTLRQASGDPMSPIRIAYRPFDRHWLIPDNRLLSVPRPALWRVRSDRQIFISEQHTQPAADGPGALFESCLPDLDHFLGHHGGRVFPFYADVEGGTPNLTPGLLESLRQRLHRSSLSAEDVLAYIAAIVGHSNYWGHFQTDPPLLSTRVPLSASQPLWSEAIGLGQHVLWLHSYGERCIDAGASRPLGPPRPLGIRGPKVLRSITSGEGQLPEKLTYDDAALQLRVGDGIIGPVSPGVWEYRVGKIRTLDKWFRYRQRNPKGRRTSTLDTIVNERWTTELTGDLINLLNVLEGVVALEPRQHDLLERVLSDDIISRSVLLAEDVLPVPGTARHPCSDRTQGSLFDA